MWYSLPMVDSDTANDGVNAHLCSCRPLVHLQVRQKLASLKLSDRRIMVRTRSREAVTSKIQTAWYVNVCYSGESLADTLTMRCLKASDKVACRRCCTAFVRCIRSIRQAPVECRSSSKVTHGSSRQQGFDGLVSGPVAWLDRNQANLHRMMPSFCCECSAVLLSGRCLRPPPHPAVLVRLHFRMVRCCCLVLPRLLRPGQGRPVIPHQT